jgi:hypothetical protein
VSTVESGGWRFTSHARSGLVALPGVATAGTFTASVTLSDGSATDPVTLALSSVADVQRLDTNTITRTYPRSGATDAETEFFPLVEFSSPALPWLVPTPDTPTGPLPWLRLVVVALTDGVEVTPSGPGKLDVLSVGGAARPAEELPDPATAPLWAHAYAATTAETTAGSDPVEAGGSPPLSGSRLLAPRRLMPDTTYVACLVPTLAAGALAGLGHADAEVAAALAAPQPKYAWSAGDGSVELPVYFSWQFSCGPGGDFETLARSLKEVPVGPDFGTRPLDLGLAGAGMPDVASTRLRFRGALTAPTEEVVPVWPDPADADQSSVDNALSGEVAAAARLTAATSSRPVVGPLLYARAAAGRGTVGTEVPAEDWFDQLNRDPRDRAAAGLGTRVLRRNVEDVMARAWQQVGDVEKANAVLRRLQVSRAIAASWHERHLSALAAGRLLSAARPVLGRVRLPAAASGGTQSADALAAVAAGPAPAGTTWRGVTTALRPGTRLGDAAVSPSAGQPEAAGRIVTTLSAGGITEARVLPDGTTSLAPPSAVLGSAAAALVSDNLRAAAAAANLPLSPAGTDGAAQVAALDDLARRAGTVSATASSALSALTTSALQARPLPSMATFAHQSGTMITTQSLDVTARTGPIDVHLPPAAPVTVHSASPPITPVRVAEQGRALSIPTTAPTLAAAEAVASAQQPAPLPATVGANPVVVQLLGDDPRLASMRDAYVSAVGRFVRAGAATALPAARGFDLTAASTGILSALHPDKTVAALASSRVPVAAILSRGDPVAPVLVGPVFADAAYLALVQAGHDAFVPGLDVIPPDSVTLVQTNPAFIVAYLAGLNSAMGHELLWRGYPTDERGTYWHSFWGAGPDIGPLHRFAGHLADNLISGAQPLLVLVLRGRLLRRYPDADIYAVVAGTDAAVPELDDATKITRPLFRDSVDPDITLVGFPITLEDMRGTGAGTGYWFVIAEHPGQPRFGLVDPDPTVTHPPLPTWDELSWADLGPTPAIYVPTTAPAATPPGTSRHWAASAADMAAITFQPMVRVAIRARDLLPPAGT